MEFEQQADLNKYVDPTIPLTWTVRWQLLKPVLPLMVCCCVVFVELLVFRLWLNDRNLISELPLLLACALAPIGLMLIAFELQIRVAHRTKRTIKLGPKRVSVSPAKYNRIGWNRISVWRLEPLGNAPALSKLTVEFSLGRKGKPQRHWSMVLRKPEQEEAFLSELEYFRQTSSNVAHVVLLAEPVLPRVSRRPLRGMAALALGLWCFVHGLPLLGVGLTGPSRTADEPRSAPRFTPKESAKLQQVARQHFSSPQQFRNFLLATGGGMTALGSVCYFWALRSNYRRDDVSSNEGASDRDSWPQRSDAGDRR